MLESAEVGHKIAKATFAREETKLREALLNGQYEMGAAQRGPILVLISGLEGGGRGETANKLNEWMDPRFIRTHAFGPGAPEEEARPLAWRYWRALPPRGQDRHLHERVVPPARRRARAARSDATRIQRPSAGSPAIRADAHRRGHRPAQVLDPPVARDQKQRLHDARVQSRRRAGA